MQPFSRWISRAGLIQAAIALGLLTFISDLAKAQPEDVITPQVREQISADVKTYSTTLDGFLRAFNDFEREALNAKGGNQDTLGDLRRRSGDLKRQLDTLQRTASSVVQKLKSNNKFSADLDTFVEAYMKRKGYDDAARIIARHNGSRALLTSLNQLFNDERAEIEKLVNNALSQRAHAAPVIAFGRGFACAVMGAKLLLKTLLSTDTRGDADDVKQMCT